MRKLVAFGLMLMVVCLGVAQAGIADSAKAYIPFENDDGTYGAGSANNPGWANVTPNPDELVNYVGTTAAPSYPKISTPAAGDGIKGDHFDGTGDFLSTQSTMTLSYKGAIVTDAMSDAQSYSFAFWVNTRDLANNGSESYIFNQFGSGAPRMKWRGDGRMQALVNGGWYYANYHTMNSNGDWVFVAMTVDNSSVRFYSGTKDTAVALAGETTGLSLPALPTLAGGTTTNVFVLGGYTYNGADKYASYDLDEFRVFSSTADGSGALTMAELEELRQYDLVPEPATLALLGLGGLVLRRRRS